ncbi:MULTISPECIES: ComEC/Rec2 family competence protein [unclassified Roseitalea]|uniref:ComEC/Rec2 family competence protein n=1 Tax=unclassified Roseitalea TaxID=2639107 RepID=UPI00273F7B06|nr:MULTISPECIES: ComEC/Rec2 family competence protein [unclassified Roseitalea]
MAAHAAVPGPADERAAFRPGGAADPARSPPRREADGTQPATVIVEPAGGDRQGRGAGIGRGLAGRLSIEAGRARFARALVDEAEFGTPFLLIPVLLIAGCTVYFALPVEPARHSMILGLAVLAAGWLAARYRAPLLARALLAGTLLVAGMGLAQWHTVARNTQMLGSEVTTSLTGRVVRIEHRANGSVRYTLDVLATERPRLYYVPDRLRVTARKPVPDLRVGDGLTGRARLLPHSGPARPGGYDFAFHGYFAGHGANGFFYGPPDMVAVPPRPGLMGTLDNSLQNGRLWLAERIKAAAPGNAGIVSSALVTGHKTAIPEPVNEALRVSGLAHILSISGLHMALVAGTVMVVLRAGLATAGSFASSHAVKKYAAVTAFAAIFVYLFLAGASVATQRSFIMLAVMLAALLADRAAISKRNLAIAAVIVIALAPAAVIGPSFHMSFAATLALIALYDIWNRARAARMRRKGAMVRPTGALAVAGGAGRFFAALAATSIVAGLASGLYAAYHFQRVAVLGLFTNLGAMPIVSLVTMPIAIVATLAIPFGLDGHLYWAMAQSAGWILAIAEWITAHSPSGMVGAMTEGAMIAATVALIWLCVCRTWLRWLGLAPAALAVVALTAGPQRPLAVISEDGRQFAAIGASGPQGQPMLAVNRGRPSAFIVEQWQMAYAAPGIVKPERHDDPVGAAPSATARAPTGPRTDPQRERGDDDPVSRVDTARPMTCSKTVCTTTIGSGDRRYVAAIATEPDAVAPGHCARFDLIVLAYAPATPFCADDTLVITAQDLALKGSAEIFPGRSRGAAHGRAEHTALRNGRPPLVARHAVSLPLRPWHDHRQYSRAARNLAPYD